VVDSATEALAALRHNSFHVLLIDAHVPEVDGFTLAAQLKQQTRGTGSSIMMLTAAEQRGAAARCQELGIAAYLMKPIIPAELWPAVRQALTVPAPAPSLAVTVPLSPVPERGDGLHILVAEDNAVNQWLVTRLLEKRGHMVTTVNTGKEALCALAQKQCDLVLMDVQMPEMDGFEATAAIRTQEQGTGGRIPIIALTAHAMKEDREKCLAAGMDGYLTKPIKPDELYTAIDRI